MADDAKRRAFKAGLPEAVAWFVARTPYGYGVRFRERPYCPNRPVQDMEREAREWLKANGWWYHNRAFAYMPPATSTRNQDKS